MRTTSLVTAGLLLASMTLFSSCFTTYQVESGKKVANDDAHLIIYRKGIIGFAVGTKIYANGKFVGKVGANKYVSCWMPPGEYLMSIGTSRFDQEYFKVNMAAGRTYAYYFTYSMSPGHSSMPWLRKMEDASVIQRRRPPMVNYFD